VVDSAGGDAQNDDSGSLASKSICGKKIWPLYELEMLELGLFYDACLFAGSGESTDTEDSGEASDITKPETKPIPHESSNLPEDIRGLLRLLYGIVSKDPAAKLKFTPEVNKHLLR